MSLHELNAINWRIFSGANLFFYDAWILFVLVLFLLHQVKEIGWRAVREDMATRGAIGMMVYFAGMLLVRGWGVPLLIMIKHGVPTIPLENAIPISLAGTIMAMIGSFCMVRVFSPAKWSFWGWLLPALVSLVAGTIAIQI